MLDLEKVLPKKNSFRQLKVAELIKHTIASAIVHGEVNSKIISSHFITITKVKISPDLKNATIYLSSLQTESINELLIEMNNHAPKFRFLIGKTIQLKSVPFITFRYDDTLEHVSKIEDLLKK